MLLVGGPVGGLLVAGLGATNVLWLNAGSFLVSALVAAAVPDVVDHRATEPPGRFLADLAEGMRFIWSNRLIRAIVLTVLLTNFLDAPFDVVMPVFAREAYGSAADLGLMFGVLGGSGLVGAPAYGAFGHRLPRRLTFVCCFAVVPVIDLGLATMPPLSAALVALAVVGVAAGPIDPLLLTVSTELVPPRLRGRVFGVARQARGRRSH